MFVRYTGPIRFFYSGDKDRATQYHGIARKLAGWLHNMSTLQDNPRFSSTMKTARINGVFIRVRKIGDGLYNAYIDVSRAGDKKIDRLIQYQFVHPRKEDGFWEFDVHPTTKIPFAGGDMVGVVFALFDDGSVEHITVPLASSFRESLGNKWVYLNSMIADVQDWFGAALVPRYEVVHATSQHLLQDDEDSIVHTAWMPKGERHYMASAFSVAGAQSTGVFRPELISDSDGFILMYENLLSHHMSSTDVGYESDLALYKPPVGQKSSFKDGPKKGSFDSSAPDADWYTSYGLQRATTPEGVEREYGIFIDAQQIVHVWPIEAAGTATPPLVNPQFIKTNVADTFVKRHTLSFPPEVYVNSIEHRTAVGAFSLDVVEAFYDGPFEDVTRYVWNVNSQGTEYATLVERLYEFPDRPFFQSDPPTAQDHFPAPVPYTYDESRAYRCSDPAVAKFSIKITPYGEALDQFQIEVSEMEIVETDVYPAQVGFAKTGAYEGAEKDDLVIAGIKAYRLDDYFDSWWLTVRLNEGTSVPTAFFNDYLYWFNCNSMGTVYGPVFFHNAFYYDPAGGSVWDATTERVTDYNFSYYYSVPPYMQQDQPFNRLQNIEQYNLAGGSSVPENYAYKEFTDVMPSFINEAEFKVVNEAGVELFSVCCRKYRDNRYGFPNFFTARVCDLNVSNGTMVFGLCESTTFVSGVVRPASAFSIYRVPDLKTHDAVNTAKKGYAIYSYGKLIDTSDNALAESLKEEVTSLPLNKNMSAWGGIISGSVFLAPPAIANILPYTFQYANTQFVGSMVNAYMTQPPPNAAIVWMVSGRYGYKDFPWGLETYAFLYRNHYSNSRTQSVQALEDFVTYSGVYLDPKKPMVYNCADNSFKADPDVGITVIDVINVQGSSFTHAELYEEAFGVPANTHYEVEHEDFFVGHWEDEALTTKGGFPVYSGNGGFSDPDSWTEIPLYAPIFVTKGRGENWWAVNSLHPDVRLYCDTNELFDNFLARYDMPEDVDIRASRGLIRAPFVARAFGIIKTEDEV